MSQADSPDSLSRLKETISQLQSIVMALETQAMELPETALEQLAADTATLATAIQTIPTEEKEASTPSAETQTPQKSEEWDDEIFEEKTPQPTERKRPTPPSSRVSPRINRRPQPPIWQQPKVIIGAISAAIAFIFVWKLTTKSPEVTLEVTQPQVPVETVVTEDQNSTIIAEEPEVRSPDISEPETIAQGPEPEPVVEEEPAPEPELVVEPEPEPEILRPLTPEQRLIASVQTQLEEASQPYGDNIVRSIEADFNQGVLRITVGDAWYLLKEKLQDRLGKEVLEVSQLLDFKKMRVEDLEGNFVARNPVVGDSLVIVRRYQDFGEADAD